jgi:type 1 glutamine amidotransferase
LPIAFRAIVSKGLSMRTHLRLLLAVVALAGAVALQAADAPAKARVLIVTGDDASPAHDWLSCASTTREVLRDSGRFEVDVVGGAEVLANEANLKNVDAIYLMLYNARTPTLSDQGKANLLNFVKGGKGLVVTHLSSASFKEWPEFKALCGRIWVMGTSGHGPRSVFKAVVVDKASPITKGVEDFSQDDELYSKLQGDAPIHVLVQAESEWSKKTEPLAFTLDYGKGRVFHHTFGHDPKAINTPAVKTLIVQGTGWAAGR